MTLHDACHLQADIKSEQMINHHPGLSTSMLLMKAHTVLEALSA